jgi:hypothetical protein
MAVASGKLANRLNAAALGVEVSIHHKSAYGTRFHGSINNAYSIATKVNDQAVSAK